ncbi:MAG TPA: EAL domain-containing protein, partial [Rhodocyclaceae bacterium]|nr:EAL domain-containing protein [Rhodocyclaceae bacterium]
LRRIEREARVEAALLDAIAAGELHLHYQPKVWADGRIECVEALVRWQSPRLGTVGPDEFIPLAERNGQIHAITAQVVELACAQQAAWRRDGIAAPPIAINLSGRDLHGGEIAEQLFDALERHDLPAYALQLEITETALIENEAMALAQLQELSRHGFAIALDDFGTGHSSLNKLSEYPISVIKIDRSFIAGIGSHARREQIVKATLSLARDLGCRSVAEGVENEAQLDFLRSHGCDLFQGYHLHRPMPANDLTALLAAAAA